MSDKKQTVLQQTIEELYKTDGSTIFGVDTMVSRSKIVAYLRDLLYLEREQIESAYDTGLHENIYSPQHVISSDYFENTYKTDS